MSCDLGGNEGFQDVAVMRYSNIFRSGRKARGGEF